MQYLAMFVERNAADLGKLNEKYPSLTEALRLSFNQLSEDLEKLLGKLTAIEREVTAGQNEEASKVWCEKMSTFLGRARMEVQKNKDALGDAVAEITTVMQQYAIPTTLNPDSGKTPQEEFLIVFSEFVQDWKKAREDNIRALRMVEKLKIRAEKKKREQMAKEEKRARLMAAGKSSKSIASQVDDVMLSLSQSGQLDLKSSKK
jgi:hypothetical protein